MVTTFYPPYHFGGDAVFVRELSEALVSRGHHVEVVHCEDAYRLRGPPPPSETAARPSPIVVHRLHSRLGFVSPLITQQTGRPGLKFGALTRILNQSFDVIHFHNISLVGGPAVLKLGNAPVKLYTTHEHWLVCPMHVLWKNKERACDKPQCIRCCLKSRIPPQLWRYTGLIERSLRHVDTLLAPSEFAARRHREGGITCPIHVLPLFTAVNTVPTGTPTPPDTGRAHFLYAGRLTRSKGIWELAEQFQAMPQYDLTIAGDGELLESLRERFGTVSNVHVAGRRNRDDLAEMYRRASALILPSIGPEVFPMVVMEAMANRLPVIVREAGGSAEAVQATGGGVVYHTSEELTQTLQRIATDVAWRETLASKALMGYQQRYTADAHLKEYIGLIESIRASKATRSAPGRRSDAGSLS